MKGLNKYSTKMLPTRHLVLGIQAVYKTAEAEVSMTRQQRRPMLLCTPKKDTLYHISS